MPLNTLEKTAVRSSNLPVALKAKLVRATPKSDKTTLHLLNWLLGGAAMGIAFPDTLTLLLDFEIKAAVKDTFAKLTSLEGGVHDYEQVLWGGVVLLFGIPLVMGIRQATGYSWGVWIGKYGVAI